MIPRTTLFASVLCLLTALSACTREPAPVAPPPPPGHGQQMTAWAGPYEYFVDFPVRPAGETVRFATHVTRIADGVPLDGGALILRLTRDHEVVEVRADAPRQPGIWLPEAIMPADGHWELTLEYEGVSCRLGTLVATSDPELAEVAAALGPSPDAIVVLKEQQWPARIRIEEVGQHELEERLPVVVHASPVPSASARLRAPSFGRLEEGPDADWPRLGEAVQAGQLLGVVRMPLLPGDPATQESARLQAAAQRRELEIGLADARARLLGAQTRMDVAAQQFNRIDALEREGARSDRDLELARETVLRAEFELEAASRARDVWEQAKQQNEDGGGPAELIFELRAPCTGLIVEADYAPGAWVDGDDELMHIVDTGRLRYGVRMHVDDLARLDHPRTFVRLPDGSTMELPGEGGELLLARPPVDPGSHVGELVYEAPAPAGLLPGAVLQAQVGIGEPREVLAVPTSALVDEDGLPVVFVQVGGEAFERRIVRLGLRGLDAVEILEGVVAGEHVVVDGAYTIRLASLSGAIPEHSH